MENLIDFDILQHRAGKVSKNIERIGVLNQMLELCCIPLLVRLTISAQAVAFKLPVTVLLTLMTGTAAAVAVGFAELEDAVD
jgi:hypothetical protein